MWHGRVRRDVHGGGGWGVQLSDGELRARVDVFQRDVHGAGDVRCGDVYDAGTDDVSHGV